MLIIYHGYSDDTFQFNPFLISNMQDIRPRKRLKLSLFIFEQQLGDTEDPGRHQTVTLRPE